MEDKFSVFGPGFILGRFCEMYPDVAIRMDRDVIRPLTSNVLYGISTVHNYNTLSHDTEVNLMLLSKVLSSLKPGDTFNFLSSWFVYGDTELPATETSPCYPKGNYSITKYLAELMVTHYCSQNDIAFRIFRLANVFGKGDTVSKKKNVLQHLINRLSENKYVELYYGGNFYRDYIHVDRVCEVLRYSSHLPANDIYNVGSGKKILFEHLIDIAKYILSSESIIVLVDDGKLRNTVKVRDFWMSTKKIQSFGFLKDVNVFGDFVRMLDELYD